jgi:hypothetical protein
MYFWMTNKLVDSIKANSLSETNKKDYYIGSSLVALIVMYIAIITGVENKYLFLATGMLSLFVILFGINLTFKTNGGAEGNDYIARVVMLSFPLLIKIYIFSFIAGILINMLSYVILGNNTIVIEWLGLLINMAVQAIYFWRLNVHLAKINT